MTTRTITFTNLDDQQVTKTLCFHMNKMDKIRFGTQHPNLPKEAQNLQTKIESIGEDDTAARGPKRRETEKVYPNDPCPCGSGKKYKQCCGRTYKA